MTKPKRNSRTVKITLIAAGLIIVAALAVFFVFLFSNNTAGSINGHKITLEELQLYANDNRTQIGAYFFKTYGADVNAPGFWETSFQGEVPRNMILDTAKKQLIKVKLEQEEALKHGIKTEIDFSRQKEMFEKENSDRKQKAQNGQAIYGPEQYSLFQYLSYQNTALVDDLKKALLKAELKPTEQQLRDSYAKLGKETLDKGYEGTVVRFVCQDAAKADEVFSAVRAQIKKGTAAADVFVKLKSKYDGILTSKTSVLDDKIHREDIDLLTLYKFCRDLPAKTFSEPYETDSGIEIDYMVSKTDLGSLSFEEAGDFSSIKWINDCFDSYFDKKVSAADIKWNDYVLRRLKY